MQSANFLKGKINFLAPYIQIRRAFPKSGHINDYSLFLDSSDRFKDRIELFVDEVHLKDEGQMLLARELVERSSFFLDGVFTKRTENLINAERR